MSRKNKLWSSSSGDIELSFSPGQVKSIPQSGSADDAVERLANLPSIAAQTWALTDATLRNVLAEYGAWTEEELSCRIDNIHRIIWIAVCDIKEDK